MINKLLIFWLTFMIFISNAFCFTDEDLSKLEYLNYGNTFINESLSSRLKRLETDIFGAEQYGNIESRFDKINRFSSNTLQNPVLAFDNSYNSFEKKSPVKKFLNKINSAFYDYGSYTGYTPSIINTNYPYSGLDGRFSAFNHPEQSFCPYNKSKYYHNFYPDYNRYNQYNNYNRFQGNYIHPPFSGAYYPNRFGRVYPQNLTKNYTASSSVKILRD